MTLGRVCVGENHLYKSQINVSFHISKLKEKWLILLLTHIWTCILNIHYVMQVVTPLMWLFDNHKIKNIASQTSPKLVWRGCWSGMNQQCFIKGKKTNEFQHMLSDLFADSAKVLFHLLITTIHMSINSWFLRIPTISHFTI